MNNTDNIVDMNSHALSRRFDTLLATDEQFKKAMPSKSVAATKDQPGLRLAEVVKTVMEGYAERPALGQRKRELVTDPATGRTTLQLLPEFETLSYRQLWAKACTIASECHHHPQHPLGAGDFVCLLGFTSVDYTAMLLANIHLGAVNVPLQTSAAVANHRDIMAETEPCILAAGVEYLDAAVDAILAGTQPQRLIVLDYDERDDDHRDWLATAQSRLADAGSTVLVDTIFAINAQAQNLPAAPLYVPAADEDPLSWLFYTSGSTGTPKGAMFTESLIMLTWRANREMPVITLTFTPMAHLIGNNYLFMALVNGGISYCSPKSDLSTLFEDLSLTRPTMASLVPRVCELLYHHYLGEVDRQLANGANPDTVSETVKRDMRESLLGGRLISIGCGSASLAPETYAFMESMLDEPMHIGYASTEIAGGTVMIDWKISRPPVIDYKLDDVPELGYFTSDKPHPRGELLVKSERFMAGYYKQPELTAKMMDEDGFYRTGDIMAELGPDNLIYLDRRNNVQKLSQGEFVAVSSLEATFVLSPDIRQIYLYGTSERAFMVAVVVPSAELIAKLESEGQDVVKTLLRRALKSIAEEQKLQNFEIPRDFIIETEAFDLKNGLLTEAGKHQRPKLKALYQDRLEALYTQLAEDQLDEIRALKNAGADQPVMETVSRAVQATLGVAQSDIKPDARFDDLGGDSLSALSFSILLKDIFAIAIPVSEIISPASNLQRLASYIENERNVNGETNTETNNKTDGKTNRKRVSYADVHNAASKTIAATELTFDKFIDQKLLAAANSLPAVHEKNQTVLLTGATGFLGRFMAVSWLERLAKTGGKLILLSRGTDAAQARQRVEDGLNTDPELMKHFQALAAEHLEVVAGDLGSYQLGLNDEEWARLADSVDLILHSGAHVNHVLPYDQLFPANVAGTAELIRLAITTRQKRFHYISTLGVTLLWENGSVDETSDIRVSAPKAELNDHYANGYNVSKWASEVLLREAHSSLALPVAVFRPAMILAHSHYQGQLNVPDMFTRLLLSLATTGIAPETFFAEDGSTGRPRSGYDGLPVDFLADAITAISDKDKQGYQSYNLSIPHDDGISLDTFTDWLIEAGCDIKRINNYSQWLSRFETAMHALPEKQRHGSLLAILSPYRQPQKPVVTNFDSRHFCTAAEAAGLPVPHLSAELIAKYVADLKHHKLL